MNNPWGISGPDFIWLYIGAFGLTLIALFILRRAGRAGSLERAGREPLTVEEVAYLSGGWPRMVETAIAALVSRNVLRIQSNGYIYTVSNPAQGPESPLEDAVIGALHGRVGRTANQIQRKLAGNPMFDRQHKSLAARGLAYGGGRSWKSVAPMGVLFAVGVARWITGIELGYPVGYLTALLAVTLLVIIVGLRGVKPGVTRAGRRSLTERGSTTGAAASVAMGGLSAYPDKDTAKILRRGRPTVSPRSRARRGAGSDSGTGFAFWSASTYSASSCGSSGGGSSCGGSSGGSSSSCGGGGGGCGGGGS
jgi:uncharacterized protein (TIGR04222 family)